MAKNSTSSPLRVLCVVSTLDRGGAETMIMNLYRNIDRSKVQFDFVENTDEKGIFEDEIKEPKKTTKSKKTIKE